HEDHRTRYKTRRMLLSRLLLLWSGLLMVGGNVRIRSATKSDLAAVEDLLKASDLPTDGVRDNFSSFVVADDDGAITGAIGLEKYGSVALLRSAVVSTDHRGRAVGRKLVEQLLERGEEEGGDEL